MSVTYHPSSFSIRSASLNPMYVSSLQLYNNTYFTYCQEKNIKLYVFYVDMICRYRGSMQTGSRGGIVTALFVTPKLPTFLPLFRGVDVEQR